MLSIEEKENKIRKYCVTVPIGEPCHECPLYGFGEDCWGNDNIIERNYRILVEAGRIIED